MSKSAATVLLVDDHPLFREGLSNLLRRRPDFKIVGESETGSDALKQLRQLNPSIVILDLSLKESSGFDLIGSILSRAPAAAVVVLSMHDEKRYAERCVRAGAKGYVMKGEAPNMIIEALLEVLRGRIFLSPAMKQLAVERFAEGSSSDRTAIQDVLTKRELEVFELLGQGLETRRVADLMGLNIKTIQAFCAKIKDKLQLANASELMREAVRWTNFLETPQD